MMMPPYTCTCLFQKDFKPPIIFLFSAQGKLVFHNASHFLGGAVITWCEFLERRIMAELQSVCSPCSGHSGKCLVFPVSFVVGVLPPGKLPTRYNSIMLGI